MSGHIAKNEVSRFKLNHSCFDSQFVDRFCAHGHCRDDTEAEGRA